MYTYNMNMHEYTCTYTCEPATNATGLAVAAGGVFHSVLQCVAVC